MTDLALLFFAQAGVPDATRKAIETAPSFADAMTRMLWLLAGTIVLLVLAARYLPKWLKPGSRVGSRGLIKVLEAKPLEPRKTLYLVQIGEQFFLLGTSEQRVEVLAGGDFEPATLALLAGESARTDVQHAAEAPAFVRKLLGVRGRAPPRDGAPPLDVAPVGRTAEREIP